MEKVDWEKLREYAWKYFDRHAEQRLKAFNFYILLCGAVIAGMCAVLREDKAKWIAEVLAGVVIPFVTIVFWKLDNRTRDLVKHSEECLKAIEDQYELQDEPTGAPNQCKLFRREEYERSKCQPHEWSYTYCFRCLFVLFFLGGPAIALVLRCSK